MRRLVQWATPVAGLLVGSPSLASEEEAVPGEEVVVESTRPRGPDPGAVSAALTVIPIDASLPADADLASVIDSASGTTVQRLGGLGDWAGVSIRGANMRHTEVCLDGIPLNPDGAASVNLSELPLWAFERVEIYRGNAPAWLTDAPMGGVVNLVTGDQAERGAGGSLSVGSHGTGRLTSLARIDGQLAGRPTDTLLVAEGFGTRGDYDYFSDNGTEYNLLDDHVQARSNNDKVQLNAHGRWRVSGDRWRLSLLDAFLSRNEGLAGHINNPTESARLATTRNLATASLEGGRWPVRGELRAWGLLRDETLDDRQGEVGTGAQWQVDQSTALGLLARGSWAPNAVVVPSLTLSARREAFTRDDLLSAQTEATRARWSLAAVAASSVFLSHDRMVLSPALALTWLDNRALGDATAEAATQRELLLAPRGGLLVRPVDGLALKANLSWGVRPPDFTELFGDRGAVIGNADLRPERGLQGDLGLRFELPESARSPQGSVELAFFANRMHDQIVFVQNAQRTMVPVNLDESRTRGVEAALTLSWWGWVETQSSLTWNDSANLSTDPAEAGNQLPRVPRWEASQRTALVWGEWLRVGHDYSYTDGSYWDRTNFYRAAPRSLHGAFLRVQPGPQAPSVELSVLNLLDRIVQVVPRNPLDPDEDDLVLQPVTDFVGYPLPGRTVLLTLRWEPRINPTGALP